MENYKCLLILFLRQASLPHQRPGDEEHHQQHHQGQQEHLVQGENGAPLQYHQEKQEHLFQGEYGVLLAARELEHLLPGEYGAPQAASLQRAQYDLVQGENEAPLAASPKGTDTWCQVSMEHH
jgi:hypothetical protein